MADETLPIRIVETTTTTNEVGHAVSVMPARYVDADTAVDEVGNAIETVPFEEVEGLVTLNSAGQAVPVIPVRIVETLTALNETGASVSVLALRGAGMPLLVTPPSIAGTLTNGSTITWTPAVWSTGTATGQWHRDGVPIVGQTGLTYTYVAATDDGTYLTVVETNGGATATSNALIAGENLAFYSTSFIGTDGTEFVGWDGWSGGATGRIQLHSGDLRQISGIGSLGFEHAAPANDHEIEFTTTVPVVTPSDLSSVRILFARFTSTSNSVELRFQNSGWALYRQASGQTTLQSFVPFSRALVTGDKVKLRVEGSYARVYLNGIETSQSAAANGGLGYDVTGVSASSKVAFRPTATAGTATYPFAVATDLAINSIAADSITISAITVEEVPGSPGDQRIRLTGTITGSITQLQPLVLSSTGEVLLDWENVSGISGSTFDVVTDTLPLAAQGDTVAVWLRDETNIETATSRSVAVPILASITATILGMNEEYWPGWSTSDPIKDHGARGSWVKGLRISDGLLDYGEIPIANIDLTTRLPASYPSGITSLINKSVETGMCKAGDYDITYPSGMTASVASISHASVVDALSGGTGKINVSQDVGAIVHIGISGTIPAGGAYVTMKPTGDPSPSVPFTDQILADYAALGGTGPIRTMATQNINSRLGYAVDAVDVVTAINNITSRACTLETVVALCNAAGRDLWWCIHHLADDTYIAWAAAYIAEHLDPGLKVFVEWSNEVWNGTLFPQGDWTAWRGSSLGYYNTNGDAATSSPVLNGFDPSTGYPTQTFTTGQRVFGNLEGTGVCMWEALQAVPTGATGVLPTSGSNSYWTRIASPTETTRARRRFQMERSIDVFDAFDAAAVVEGYSARSRIVRVLGVWANSDTTSNILQFLDWQSGYLKTDMVAAGFYVGGGVAGYNLGTYGSNHVTGWGATEKARYNTDLPQWLTDLFAALNAATDPTIDLAVAMKHGLEAALRVAPYNLAPNTIQFGQYECGQHVVLTGYPNGTDAATAFAAYRADARLATWWGTYLDALRDRIGGTNCVFSMVSQNTGLQGWGIMFQQGDQMTEQFEAVSGWIAANL